jgi:hypothetical protein
MPYKDPDKFKEWESSHKKKITMSLMTTTDADILDWLEDKTSMQGAIKEAIRFYMEHEKR